MCGAKPPLPHTFAWPGAEVHIEDHFFQEQFNYYRISIRWLDNYCLLTVV